MSDSKSNTYILLILTIASFLPAFIGSAINIALPTIGRELAIDAVLLAWVSTSYVLAMAMFQVPFGRAGDLYGRKKIFTLGTAIFTIFSFLSAVSISPAMLILFRFFQGMGSAMIFSTAVAILTEVFPPGMRGKALGINVTAVYLGLSLGPFVGGVLTNFLGWRSIFLFCVPFGLLVIASVFKKMEGEWTEAKGERLDLVGAVLYSAVLFAVMCGLTIIPSFDGGLILLGGAAGLYFFLKWESATAHPILNINLFKDNRVFAFSNLAALINYAATFAVAFVLSLYLQYIKGLDPVVAGLILVSQPAVQTALSSHAGMLSDRIEPRMVASAGMGLTAVGLLLLTLLDSDTGLAFIVFSLVLLGVGLALFSSPNTNAVMSSVEKKYYGVASGMVGTMRSIGMVLSMALIMMIFSMVIGRVEIGPQNYALFLSSVKVVFSIFTVLCIAGIFFSFSRGNVR